ncbi:MAG: PPC domain-containing DNA-binding protein [Sporomusa sp.]
MDQQVYVLQLSTGENVIDAVRKFVSDQNWEEGVVQGALGSVVNVIVGNAAGNTLPPQVQKTNLAGPFEILSCTGEVIRRDDGYYTHIHASGSLSDAQVFGGGLQTAEVFKGLKVYLQKVR